MTKKYGVTSCMTVKHRHFIVIATFKETPFISEKFTNEWIGELVGDIDMEVLNEPCSVHCDKKGNEGISSFCLITTSHISLHSWEALEPNLVQLDVYSCKEFDTEIVLNKLREFGPITIGSKFLNRSIRATRGWIMFEDGMG